MADARQRIFIFADRLYAKALGEMEAERFRQVDMYAFSCYGAATYLSVDRSAPAEFLEQVERLRSEAWALAQRSYSEQKRRLMEPRMSGIRNSDFPDVQAEIEEIARISSSGA